MRMAHQHVGQGPQLVARVDRAGRVVGRVQDQPLGAGRDRALQGVRIELEAVLGAHGRGHRLASRQQHRLRIGGPEGRGDHHLIAGR